MRRLLVAAMAAMIATPALADVTVRGNQGGEVVLFMLKKARLAESGERVRFAGRCDSACTILLGLPRSQTCVTPRARFGFHRAYSRKGNKAIADVATQFMVKEYPGWVRSWIAANGGLTSSIKTMGYSYASKYMRTCE